MQLQEYPTSHTRLAWNRPDPTFSSSFHSAQPDAPVWDSISRDVHFTYKTWRQGPGAQYPVVVSHYPRLEIFNSILT